MIIGKYRAKNMTIPQLIFQNNELSNKPSKPEPLLAGDEANSYKTCDKP